MEQFRKKKIHSFKWGKVLVVFTGEALVVVLQEPLMFMMVYSLLRKLRLEPGPCHN